MDYSENQDHQPITDITPEPESIHREPVAEAPVPEEHASGAYHGAGVGQKESPFANSPYYSSFEAPPRQETGYIPGASHNPNYTSHTQPQAEPQPRPKKEKKPRKKMGPFGKRIIAALLAAALVGGACGITAWTVNKRWEEEADRMEERFASQIAALQDQIDQAAANSGVSVSDSPVSAEGLTPAQVYAANVNSVVAISNLASSGMQNVLQGSGSGFILSADGYIVSNYHVVEGAQKLTVTTYLGQEYEATLVGSDELNDVALLKVDATDLDPVEIGSSDDLIVGDMVVAIGNPLGELTSTQTVGYVSGKDRTVSTDGSIINMLQTDAAINPGNSGGPLFNMKGQVIGITTAKYSGSTSSGASIEGIGFAIPIDDVMSMIEDFKNYGYLRNQAYLGVSVYDTDSTTASMYSLPNGSYVVSVEEGGSAARAGVQPKDIIIAIGEYTVESNAELTAALRKFSAGDTTTITVYRAGAELELSITFDERPQSLEPEATEPELGEMPSSGSYEDWYNYFFPFFGGGNGN